MPIITQIDRFFDTKGEPATLRTRTESGSTDSYGDPVLTTSTQAITVIRAYTTIGGANFPFQARTQLTETRSHEVNFFTADDITLTINASGPLPEIDYRNDTYTVIDYEEAEVGATRLICRLDRT